MSQIFSRIKVKVCGMTQPTQVNELVELGVSAVGVILDAQSPRLITLDQALEIRAQIPAFISMVGVFVDSPIDRVNEYSEKIGLDLVQLHGGESTKYADQLCTPYIKAIRAKNAEQVQHDILLHPKARAVLLDPYVKGKHGGTGQSLEPDTWPKMESETHNAQKLILAGGLSPDNLLSKLNEFRPYAVDLNSGVEKAPGIKNLDLVEKCLNILER